MILYIAMTMQQQQNQSSSAYMQPNRQIQQQLQPQHQQLQQQLQAPQLQPQSQQQLGQLQQEPTAAEINVMLSSLGLGLSTNEALQLANWDLKKLAMYLVSECCQSITKLNNNNKIKKKNTKHTHTRTINLIALHFISSVRLPFFIHHFCRTYTFFLLLIFGCVQLNFRQQEKNHLFISKISIR